MRCKVLLVVQEAEKKDFMQIIRRSCVWLKFQSFFIQKSLLALVWFQKKKKKKSSRFLWSCRKDKLTSASVTFRKPWIFFSCPGRLSLWTPSSPAVTLAADGLAPCQPPFSRRWVTASRSGRNKREEEIICQITRFQMDVN